MKSLIYLVNNTSTESNPEGSAEEPTPSETTLQTDSSTGKPPPPPTFK